MKHETGMLGRMLDTHCFIYMTVEKFSHAYNVTQNV